MKKNVSGQKVGAQLVSATDGSAFTGSVTVSVTGDAGTQATGSVGSGACTHEGNGYHTYAPAQAETNYDLVAFTFTGTGAVPATVQIYTTFPQTVDNATNISAIKTTTDKFVFTVANQVDCNPYSWRGGTIPAVNVTGVPLVDAKYLLGTIFATPATAGIIDVNLKNIANAVVDSTSAQIGVNLVKTAGTALGTATAGYVPADIRRVVGNSTAATNIQNMFDGTGYAGGTIKLGVDVVSISGDSTAADNAESFFDGTGYAGTNNVMPTVTNLTNAPTNGDFTATMKTSLSAATPAVTVSDKTGFALTSAYDFAKGTVAMTESYAAQGSSMTPVEALYQAVQHLGESSISGTTKTVKKRDAATTAKTFTLDSSTAPTSITEAT